jgi:hypothetical protein
MSLTVETAASSTDLTTTAKVKSELGLTSSTYDTWIDEAIKAASRQLELYANNFWAHQKYLEVLPGSGSTRLMLARTPIVGTPEIVIDSNSVVDFTVDDDKSGVLYRRQGWTQYVSYWPGAARDPDPFNPYPNISVTYYAGYNLSSFDEAVDGVDDLPENIERACIVTVAGWFRRKGRDPDVSWKQVGGLALGFRKQSGDEDLSLPPDARSLVSKRVF